MAKLKFRPLTAPLADAIASAYEGIDNLAEEMDNWASGMEEGNLANSEKCQLAREAADSLQNVSQPDVPEFLQETDVYWNEQVKRNEPRWLRLANIVQCLQAVVEKLSELSEDESTKEEQREEIDQLKDEVESTLSDIESVEFPGMFG